MPLTQQFWIWMTWNIVLAHIFGFVWVVWVLLYL